MNAELKSMFSPDVDLRTYHPEPSDRFGFLLRAMIGPEGGPGEESFDFFVCTPKWLLEQRETGLIEDVVFGTNKLIVFDYDIPLIRDAISRFCRRCVGASWQEI